ncbi:hypothetical protein IV01_07635 [Pseudomonas syringae]|uniref:Uncharacterized protein n=1 Tax=Pseudomonas syringae TaxID=317 RepID=A0A085VMQ7_PSESX|nr:hypothetical protein IV01_07635 [Pseudomonas syringae]
MPKAERLIRVYFQQHFVITGGTLVWHLSSKSGVPEIKQLAALAYHEAMNPDPWLNIKRIKL